MRLTPAAAGSRCEAAPVGVWAGRDVRPPGAQHARYSVYGRVRRHGADGGVVDRGCFGLRLCLGSSQHVEFQEGCGVQEPLAWKMAMRFWRSGEIEEGGWGMELSFALVATCQPPRVFPVMPLSNLACQATVFRGARATVGSPSVKRVAHVFAKYVRESSSPSPPPPFLPGDVKFPLQVIHINQMTLDILNPLPSDRATTGQ